jgi:hypothetical protein
MNNLPRINADGSGYGKPTHLPLMNADNIDRIAVIARHCTSSEDRAASAENFLSDVEDL